MHSGSSVSRNRRVQMRNLRAMRNPDGLGGSMPSVTRSNKPKTRK